MRDVLKQKIAHAICAETCAFKGEPPCYAVASETPPECDEPGCVALAAAVAEALRPDNEVYWLRWKRGEPIEDLARDRGCTRERMRLMLTKMDKTQAEAAHVQR